MREAHINHWIEVIIIKTAKVKILMASIKFLFIMTFYGNVFNIS